MAKFLEAFGRSNALSTATRDITDFMLKRKMAEESTQINRLEAIKLSNEIKQQNRITEIRNKPIDLRAHPMFGKLSDPGKARAMKYFEGIGVVDERGIGRIGDLMDAVQTIESSSKLFSSLAGSEVEEKKKTFLTLESQYNEQLATGKTPDDASMQKLAVQMNTARQVYLASSTGFEEHLQNLTEQEAKAASALELQEAKRKGAIDVVQAKAKLGVGKEFAPSAEEKLIKFLERRHPELGKGEISKIVLSRKGRPGAEIAMEVYNSMIDLAESPEAASAAAQEALTFYEDLKRKEQSVFVPPTAPPIGEEGGIDLESDDPFDIFPEEFPE